MAALGEITWGMTVASTRLWAPEKCPRATCRQCGDRARLDGEPLAGAGVQLPQAEGHEEGTSCARDAGLVWNQQAAEQEHPGRHHTRK